METQSRLRLVFPGGDSTYGWQVQIYEALCGDVGAQWISQTFLKGPIHYAGRSGTRTQAGEQTPAKTEVGASGKTAHQARLEAKQAKLFDFILASLELKRTLLVLISRPLVFIFGVLGQARWKFGKTNLLLSGHVCQRNCI